MRKDAETGKWYDPRKGRVVVNFNADAHPQPPPPLDPRAVLHGKVRQLLEDDVERLREVRVRQGTVAERLEEQVGYRGPIEDWEEETVPYVDRRTRAWREGQVRVY